MNEKDLNTLRAALAAAEIKAVKIEGDAEE